MPTPEAAPLRAVSGGAETAAACPVPSALCRHCGLPLSAAQRRRGDEFCCGGCERVHALIHEEGLDRFYDLRRGAGAPPPELRADGYAWLDGLLSAGDDDPERPLRLSLDIQGIHCAACVWILDSLFRRHPGGLDLVINPSVGTAEIVWVPARGDLRRWLAEAERFGYRFGPRRKTAPRKSRELLIRLGVTVAAAMNVMIFSLCYYFGLAPADGALYGLFGWLSAGLASIAVAVGGWVFIKAAALGLRHGLVHLDLPIAAGILLAFGGSLSAYLTRGPEAAYFDTVTIFVALMLVGRWLQERVLERNRNSLLADGGIDNLFARRYRDGTLETVAISEVRTGDEIWVVPGDLVPVESVLVERPAELALDWITGESELLAVEPGGRAPAGAINAGTGTLRLAAREDFAVSGLHALLDAPAVDRGATPGAEGQGWWARVSAVYVGAVFLLAAGAFALWIPRGLDHALSVTVSVLVVACPCALGLAVPLAHELVHLALRRRGVFLRGGGFLDRAVSVRQVLFDKTGTVTLGRLEPTPASRAALEGLDPALRAVLVNLAVRSNHPVSRALALAAAGRTGRSGEKNGDAVRLGAVERDLEVAETAGQGLTLTRGGHRYRLGRRAFALESGAPGAPSAATAEARDGAAAVVSTDGPETPAAAEAVFSVDGREIAAFAFRERIKEDAREEVELLGRAGYTVYLTSGDTEEKVREAARRLAIPLERAHARMTPEDKARFLRSVDHHDTLMVGDGLNDGPGLEAAHCAATPAVDHPALPGRADFYFLGEGIAAVRRALLAARRLRAVVRGNLLLAVAYNLTALALCYLGLVTPVVAAVLMPASSVLVVSLTAWRLSGRRLAWMS